MTSERQLPLPGIEPDLKPMLIGLYSDAMGSGKTTAASFLQNQRDFRRVRFAGAFKGMVGHLLRDGLGVEDGLAFDMIDGDLKEVGIPALGNKSPRFLMQTLGTDWGRDLIDPDIWLNIGMARARGFIARGVSVVIDDVRFPNEAEAILEAGGKMVKVERPDAKVTLRHRSEGALSDIRPDAILLNTSTVAALQQSMGRIVEVLGGPF